MMGLQSAHLTLAIPYITVYLEKYMGNNINPKQDSMDKLKKVEVDRIK
jgi:hypothetical protein